MDIQLYPALWVPSEWNFSTSTWVFILFYPFLSFSTLFYPFLSFSILFYPQIPWFLNGPHTLYTKSTGENIISTLNGHDKHRIRHRFVTDFCRILPPGLTMGGRCKGFGLPDVSRCIQMSMKKHIVLRCIWLVVFRHPSEKWWSSSMGRIIYPIYEMENKECSKPPSSVQFFLKSLKISDSLTIKKALKLIRSGNSAVRRVSTAVSPRALSQTKVQLGPILNPSGLSANCHWNSLNSLEFTHWNSREFHGYWRLLYQIFSGNFQQFEIPWSTAELIAARISSSLLPQSISKTWLKISWEIEIPSGTGNLT